MKSASGDRDWRRDMGHAFQRAAVMIDGRVISSRAGGTVSKVELERDLKVSGDQRIFIEVCEAINVFHHSCWAMKGLEEVP